jgi:nucleotide-binding universal stress UspA family protein
MSRVLAFTDDSPTAADVLTAAATIAQLIGATVEAVRAVDDPDVGRSLIAQLDADDVAFGVIGSRSVASKPEAVGHVAEAVLIGAPAPLVVVPPGGRPLVGDGLVLLLPLDGRLETSEAAVPIAAALTGRLGNVITLHVFDSSTVPMFVTSIDDQEVIANEFLATHCGDHSDRIHLRLGHAAAEILDVAAEEHADAIVLTWSQDLSPGHADTIRQLLHETTVPIILQPIGTVHRSRGGRTHRNEEPG